MALASKTSRIIKGLHTILLRLTFIVLLCIIQLSSAAQGSALLLADPAMFYHKGVYYLYGTTEGRTSEGFLVYTSVNKKVWHLSSQTVGGFALRKGDAFGNNGFWAPQVFAYKDSFYMAYVADEQIAIAVSSHPAGPFRQHSRQPLAAPVKQIDPFIFIDDDGKKYLYHVRLDKGNKIFVGELLDDLSGVKPGTVKECIRAEAPWENTANATWPVAEGPSIIKQNGIYYLFYTANDFRNPDYAVGYAIASAPMGPWKKFHGNPIMNKKTVGQNGPGHGDFVPLGQNRWWYVFHTHHSPEKVAPRKTAMIRMRYNRRYKTYKNGVFQVQPRSFRFLQYSANKGK